MREIKFRGKHLETNKWIYGNLMQGNGKSYITILEIWDLDKQCIVKSIPENWVNSAEQYEVDPETVGQFTGLKDKNGTEIYEGDCVDGVIYKDGTINKGRILWDYNGWRILTKDKSVSLDLTEKLTIIGNIHENPELLK